MKKIQGKKRVFVATKGFDCGRIGGISIFDFGTVSGTKCAHRTTPTGCNKGPRLVSMMMMMMMMISFQTPPLVHD
jgi:hypothetical protein